MQFESSCLMYILIRGQRRNHSLPGTLCPCSHTQFLTHSNYLLILLWTVLWEHLYFLLWRAVWLKRWGTHSGKFPSLFLFSIVADEKSFLTTDFTEFTQIYDKCLSVPIMLNALLQMAVKGRDVTYIRPTVCVSILPPKLVSITDSQNFQIYCQCCKEVFPLLSLSLFIYFFSFFVLQYSVHHVTFVLKKLETTLEILVLFFHLFFILI